MKVFFVLPALNNTYFFDNSVLLWKGGFLTRTRFCFEEFRTDKRKDKEKEIKGILKISFIIQKNDKDQKHF